VNPQGEFGRLTGIGHLKLQSDGTDHGNDIQLSSVWHRSQRIFDETNKRFPRRGTRQLKTCAAVNVERAGYSLFGHPT
jgi:hypothetical protein